ncbi:translation elongation factor Ts [Candidatus Palauibacter sp.]|uniref:translation elongation factor Ts n=1 Tax=Candidatus Palauibacter sp. TaxID=3101350 RepID=UPI003AF2BA21
MTQITAGAVKALRDRTGAGMMDCKRALIEAEGDAERAVDLLRKAGAAKAAKRVARDVSEGTIRIATRDGSASMVEVLSETDFVVRSEAFEAFATELAERLFDVPLGDGQILEGEALLGLDAASGGGSEIEDRLNELRVQVGENVRVGRAVRYDLGEGGAFASYVHFGSRIGVLIEISQSSEEAVETARGIAMHAAATNPSGLSPEDIPADVVERERALLTEQALEQGKPPSITEKIVEGRMRKFFEENALLWQSYVRDPDLKVRDLLSGAGGDLAVRRFARFEVGG